MQVLLKNQQLILIATDKSQAAEIAAWKAVASRPRAAGARGRWFRDWLWPIWGHRPIACRQSINVTSMAHGSGGCTDRQLRRHALFPRRRALCLGRRASGKG